MHAGAVMQTELACSLSGGDDSTAAAAAELSLLSLSLPRVLTRLVQYTQATHTQKDTCSLSNFSPLRAKP